MADYDGKVGLKYYFSFLSCAQSELGPGLIKFHDSRQLNECNAIESSDLKWFKFTPNPRLCQ